MQRRAPHVCGDEPGKAFVASQDAGSITIPGVVMKAMGEAQNQGVSLTDFFLTGKTSAK